MIEKAHCLAWESTLPINNTKKPRHLKKHNAQKQHQQTIVFDKTQCPKTMSKNFEEPQRLRKHSAHKQHQKFMMLEKKQCIETMLKNHSVW